MSKLHPSHSEEIDLIDMTKEEFLAIALDAILNNEWKIESIDHEMIIAYTEMSFTSWGECITIETKEPDKAVISSICSGEQLLDLGRNKNNVDKFIETFNQLSLTATAAEIEGMKSALNNTKIELQEIKENARDVPETKNFKFSDISSALDPVEGYFVTPIIIMINLAVFILMAITGANLFAPDSQSLIFWGATYEPLLSQGEAYRLLTACFVHIGIVHLLVNMYALFIIGAALESVTGRFWFVVAYILSGVAANLSSMDFSQPVISAGASGAIFGLFGVFTALASLKALKNKVGKSTIYMIFLYLGYNLVYGFSDASIDLQAHLGGFFSGLIIGYALYPSLNPARPKVLKYGIALLMTGIIIIFANISIPEKGQYNYQETGVINAAGTEDPESIYKSRMITFFQNDQSGINLIRMARNKPEEEFLQTLKDSGTFYWYENLNLIDELQQYDWGRDRNNLLSDLKDYCDSRCRLYYYMYKELVDNTDKYDTIINSSVNVIDSIMKHIDVAHGN